MLKILLWRLLFEVFNTLKVLGYRGPTVRYFAFGANLSSVVRRRRRISIYSEKTYILRNYKLSFSQPGPFEGMGFASIEKSPGDPVAGKILEIPKIDEWRLDCFEAYYVFHRHRKVRLDSENFYFYQATEPQEGLRPSTEYRNHILSGFIEPLGEDEISFVDYIKNIPPVLELVPRKHLNLVFKNYNIFGTRVAPWLMSYDRFCFYIFMKFALRPSIYGNRIPM